MKRPRESDFVNKWIVRGLGKSTLSSECLRLYSVLQMLNKLCSYGEESLNINIALSLFFSVCGKIVPVESIGEETGTCVITGLGNDPGSPILEFLEFIG